MNQMTLGGGTKGLNLYDLYVVFSCLLMKKLLKRNRCIRNNINKNEKKMYGT